MKSFFVCLANSKKYGERCIAGIQLTERADGTFHVLKKDNKPQWIRPVTNAKHGEVAAHLVDHIELNDIVEIDIVESCPKGYQSENALFVTDSLKVIRKIQTPGKNLESLVYSGSNLFGSTGKAVSKDKIGEIDHSLLFIKVSKPHVYNKSQDSRSQFRMVFEYEHEFYDLPITDIHFIDYFEYDPYILNSASNFYLTISLGIAFEGWYYKLVAGVVYF